MGINRNEAEEKFDEFLMVMDDQLDYLQGEAEKHGITLDLSGKDIENLEKLFDAMSSGIDSETRAGLVVVFARHLGEVFRINHGGEWRLPLDDEKNVNYNTPVIAGFGTIEGLEFAPISVVRAYSLRKKPGTMKRAVDAVANPQPLDLSGLVEE